MLFRNTALFPTESGGPADTLHVLWPTAAEPVTFAPPVDVTEDETAITLLFDVAGHEPERIEVELRGGTVFVLGEPTPAARSPRSMRAFVLGARADPSAVQADVVTGRLSVRVGKRQGGGARAIIVVAK